MRGGGFKQGKQNQGPPGSGAGWRLVARLLLVAGALLLLQSFLPVNLLTCNGEDEQPTRFLSFPAYLPPALWALS